MMDQPRLTGVVYNARLGEARALAERLARRAGGEGEVWTTSADDMDRIRSLLPRTRLIITVGGDGTILRTVRATAPLGIPLLGVNLGRVGFMAEMRAEEALDRLDLYLEGKGCWVEERTMLTAQVLPTPSGPPEEREPVHGLNDAVVGRGAVSRLIVVEARVDGALLGTYAADALIVATATGSTGYALAAGGPILHPCSSHLLLTPVAPHLTFSSSLVLPPEAVVDLTVLTDNQAMLSVDGVVDRALPPGTTVRVSRSPLVARFLRASPPSTFYSTLLQRLGLTGRPPSRTAEAP